MGRGRACPAGDGAGPAADWPGGLLRQLAKTVLETALNEMTEHLGHEKNGPVRNQTRNVAIQAATTLKSPSGKPTPWLALTEVQPGNSVSENAMRAWNVPEAGTQPCPSFLAVPREAAGTVAVKEYHARLGSAGAPCSEGSS